MFHCLISGPLSFIYRSGVQLCPVTQVTLLGVSSRSAHLNDMCNNESAKGLTTQHPVASPNRRLRFEDETEMEAESRYQERQRSRGGIWRKGGLVSKPDLNLYICDRVLPGTQGVGQNPTFRVGSGHRSNLRQHPQVIDDRGWGLCHSILNLRTEPIRETYIGSVIPGVTRGGGAMFVSNIQVRRSENHVELPENQVTHIIDLPINPYAPDQLATLTSRCPSTSSTPPPMTSSVMPSTVRPNSRKAGQDRNQDQEVLGGPVAAHRHRDLRSGAEVTEKRRNSFSSCLPSQVELLMTSQRWSESPGQTM